MVGTSNLGSWNDHWILGDPTKVSGGQHDIHDQLKGGWSHPTLSWCWSSPGVPPTDRTWLWGNPVGLSLIQRAQEVFWVWFGYGSIPINTIFRGMNIHLPAILMFTRGTRFWHTAIWKFSTFSDLQRSWDTLDRGFVYRDLPSGNLTLCHGKKPIYCCWMGKSSNYFCPKAMEESAGAYSKISQE